MTLAMKRLKNVGWLALVFLVAILLYPLSLNVAALHSDLKRIDQKIVETKSEISFLQAELRTRASLQQLEEWNKLLYDYKPPTAEQFLAGEHALASFGGSTPKLKPVVVSVAAEDGVAPAGVIGSPFAPMEAGGERKLADASSKQKDRQDDVKSVPEKERPSVSNRTEAMAGMDDKLLSDDLMKDIDRAAKQERAKR